MFLTSRWRTGYNAKPIGVNNDIRSYHGAAGPNERRSLNSGLRIPVATLVGMVAQSMRTEQILDEYPDLQPEDIQQALRYAVVTVDEREPPVVGGD